MVLFPPPPKKKTNKKKQQKHQKVPNVLVGYSDFLKRKILLIVENVKYNICMDIAAAAQLQHYL